MAVTLHEFHSFTAYCDLCQWESRECDSEREAVIEGEEHATECGGDTSHTEGPRT